MKEFTFVVFSYNQEKFIIEHLESIKYQIKHYGELVNCKLILADDFSTDRTVFLATDWLNENRGIFSSVKILESNCNLGIVKNYIRCLRNVDTDFYKILAGDDLYYKNNIFALIKEFCITPVLRFHKEQISDDSNYFRYKIMVKNKKNIRLFLQDMLKNDNCIDAPGVFLKKTIVDEKLIACLQEYTWIEDLPSWNYFVNSTDVNISIYDVPYILYRTDEGISNNKAHSKRKGMLEDEKKIYTNIYVYKDKKPYSLICKYRKSIFKRLCKYYYDKFDADMIAFNNNMNQAENEAAEYLALIRKNAEDFKTRRGLK